MRQTFHLRFAYKQTSRNKIFASADVRHLDHFYISLPPTPCKLTHHPETLVLDLGTNLLGHRGPKKVLSRASPAAREVGGGDWNGLSRSTLAALLLAHQQAAPEWLVQIVLKRGKKTPSPERSKIVCHPLVASLCCLEDRCLAHRIPHVPGVCENENSQMKSKMVWEAKRQEPKESRTCPTCPLDFSRCRRP